MSKPREWKDLIMRMDGVTAVNLAEPSEGDLERVVNAYRDLRSAYERLEKIQQDDESDKFKLMTERDALKTQLAEVTRENLVLLELAGKEHIDRTLAQAELRAERAKLSENIEAERELRKIAVGIERAKAERYREALKLVEKETIEMGIHGLTIYVQQALSEAEGE